jgi:HD-GYP domain-containing protein (c-di-GMP phosphodiesterase class II)
MRILARQPDFRFVIPHVLFHHEHWDGRGYPCRRRGEEIPLEARVLAVADAFDAMTSPRPYGPPLPVSEALAEIDRCAGTQFDPLVAGVFVEHCRAAPRLIAAG